jgi:ABC-type branched-subunit amino acid transport system substrate-binding protein
MQKNSLFIPVVSHCGMVGDEFFAANKEYLKDIDLSFIQTFSFAKNSRDGVKNLAKQYLHLYSKTSINEINAPTGLSQAYDATMLIATAIKNAKSFNSTDIKNSLQNIELYEGTLKTYKKPFSETNHNALNINDFFMAKFDKDGYIVPFMD